MNLSMKKLVVPIFLDMFLHFITLIINTYMVTKVSVHLVGAMGAGNQVMDLFMTIFNFLSMGCSVVVAQALGAKQKDTRKYHVKYDLWYLLSHHHLRLWLQHLKFTKRAK